VFLSQIPLCAVLSKQKITTMSSGAATIVAQSLVSSIVSLGGAFPAASFGLACATVLAHSAYAYGTARFTKVQVHNKSIFVDGGKHFTRSQATILDGTTNTCMAVNNSLWFWRWDSAERFMQLKEGDVKNVRMYGWRIPILGLYPNIVDVDVEDPSTKLSSPPPHPLAAQATSTAQRRDL